MPFMSPTSNDSNPMRRASSMRISFCTSQSISRMSLLIEIASTSRMYASIDKSMSFPASSRHLVIMPTTWFV